MIIKNKKNGFTLLEILLYVGMIALLMAAVIRFYIKKDIDARVYTMTNYMVLIDRSVGDSYSSSLNYMTLSNAAAIASNLIPSEIVSKTGMIGNLFGGSVTLTPSTVGASPAYSITLNQVPNYACTKFATGFFANYVQSVTVNGISVKTAGLPVTSAEIANAAASCVQKQNTISFINFIVPPVLDAVGSIGLVRNKEVPYHISTIGNPSSGIAPSCLGGSSWDGSFCSCPSGTSWNGTSCLAFGSVTPQPGWCPLGEGWAQDTQTCVLLPQTALQLAQVNPSTTPWTGGNALPCPVGQVYAPGTMVCTPLNTALETNNYIGGRNLSAVITTPPFEIINGTASIPPAGSANVSGTVINWAVGNSDNLTVQTCVNGSWDPATLRCVTP